MAKVYQETEYLYSSSYVRAMENSLLGREQLGRMAESASAEEVLSMLPELGFIPCYGKDGKLLREETLLSLQKERLAELSAIIPSSLLDLWRYPYDAHNVKSILKCQARGIEPDGLFLPLGTIAPETLAEALRKGASLPLPKRLAEALPRAQEDFNKSRNASALDMSIDRALFADMLDLANDSGVPYLVELVASKIDLTNLMSCLRLTRLACARPTERFREVFLAGGTISFDSLLSCLTAGDGGEAQCLRLLTELFSSAKSTLSVGAPLWQIERVCDDLWLSVVKKAKFCPFGIPVTVGYLIGLDYQIKNIRIVLTCKDAGIEAPIIRERLRDCYV